jgi:ketosteroid isomerase-like protein
MLEPITDFIDAGERVVVRFNWRGSGRGPELNAEVTAIYTVRKGKVFHKEYFWDHADALEAAGLRGVSVSEENVRVVQSFYDAWARDEFPGPVELMDPNIEYVNPAGAVEPGTRRGLAAFRRAVDKVLVEGWESWEMDPERFRAVGDQVAVVVRYRASCMRPITFSSPQEPTWSRGRFAALADSGRGARRRRSSSALSSTFVARWTLGPRRFSWWSPFATKGAPAASPPSSERGTWSR